MYLEYDALYELLNKSGDGRAEHALEMREKLRRANTVGLLSMPIIISSCQKYSPDRSQYCFCSKYSM